MTNFSSISIAFPPERQFGRNSDGTDPRTAGTAGLGFPCHPLMGETPCHDNPTLSAGYPGRIMSTPTSGDFSANSVLHAVCTNSLRPSTVNDKRPPRPTTPPPTRPKRRGSPVADTSRSPPSLPPSTCCSNYSATDSPLPPSCSPVRLLQRCSASGLARSTG